MKQVHVEVKPIRWLANRRSLGSNYIKFIKFNSNENPMVPERVRMVAEIDTNNPQRLYQEILASGKWAILYSRISDIPDYKRVRQTQGVV